MRRGVVVAACALVGALGTSGTALAADVPRWCAPDRLATDRPDAVAGFQIHVIYAVPADAPNRFAELVVPIARDIATIDEWWRAQDASRTPRFDLFNVAGCESVFGRLDVSDVRLPNGAGHYGDLNTRGDNIAADLIASGFADPDKKYLVYFEGPVSTRRTCGESYITLGNDPRHAFPVIYVTACGETVGAGAIGAGTAAHELIHNLGAFVPASDGRRGPNACADDPYHPCDDPFDVLAAFSRGAPLSILQLDLRRDDYYGHSGAWWDVQDSLFLARLNVADQSPPAGPAAATATSEGSTVIVSWPAATDASEFTYRVYRDGRLVRQTNERQYVDAAEVGDVVTYAVRAADVHGQLSPRVTVRFKVGFGIVDEAGRLLRDTVAPSDVEPLRVRVRSKRVARLQWAAAADPGGLRGYRVLRNGRLYRVVTARFLDVPRRLKGTWRVQAVDTAGNVGPLSDPVRVR